MTRRLSTSLHLVHQLSTSPPAWSALLMRGSILEMRELPQVFFRFLGSSPGVRVCPSRRTLTLVFTSGRGRRSDVRSPSPPSPPSLPESPLPDGGAVSRFDLPSFGVKRIVVFTS